MVPPDGIQRSLLARWARSPALGLAVILTVAYGYFYQAGGWNQNSRFDLVRAVVEDHSVVIDRFHRNTGDKARRDGHYYCDKAPGVSLLAVPGYAVVHAVAGTESPSPTYLERAAWLSTVTAIGIPSVAGALALFWLLAIFGLSVRARAAVTLAYGLGTLAWPYATLLYGHQLVAAFGFAAFAWLARIKYQLNRAHPLSLVAIGALLGLAVVVEYPAALVVMVVLIYAASWLRPLTKIAWLALGGAAMAVVLGLYHWVAFGGPLTLPYEFSTQVHRHQGFFMGLGVPNTEALRDILFTSYRGLFWSSPWLLLAIPGAVVLWRQSGRRAELVVCIAIFMLFVWLNASLVDWQGGWAMGPRYLVGAIPYLAVLAGGLALLGRRAAQPDSAQRRIAALAAAVIGAALAAYSTFLMLVGTAVKPEVPTHIRAPFGEFLLPAFWKGQLSISTQSIDMAGYPPNGPRAAWNLGHGLGLDGFASLLPLAVAVAGGLAWLWWATRVASEGDAALSGGDASRSS